MNYGVGCIVFGNTEMLEIIEHMKIGDLVCIDAPRLDKNIAIAIFQSSRSINMFVEIKLDTGAIRS
jgi:hypothetical protein